jgi:DNA (cytosine-5)-methyltransferase 1
VLDGSPPCQGFSTAGKRKVTDNRNDLFKEYVRLIDGLQPKVFVMENVSGMIKGKMKGMFIEIMKTLKSLNYQVKCKLMNAKYYNVPQSRERVIFIGVRRDLGIEPSYPVANKKLITVKEAIGFLPLGIPGNHQKQVIKAWYKSQPGQSLRKAVRLVGSFQSCRLNPNKPSNTQIKAHFNWHYKIPRQLTIQEATIIQSFPEQYNFAGVKGEAKERIGNSVPPKFMQAIAENIRDNILIPAMILSEKIESNSQN